MSPKRGVSPKRDVSPKRGTSPKRDQVGTAKVATTSAATESATSSSYASSNPTKRGTSPKRSVSPKRVGGETSSKMATTGISSSPYATTTASASSPKRSTSPKRTVSPKRGGGGVAIPNFASSLVNSLSSPYGGATTSTTTTRKPLAAVPTMASKPMQGVAAVEINPAFKNADPSRWRLKEVRTNGKTKFTSRGKQQVVKGPIEDGIEEFKSNPDKYWALTYQIDMLKLGEKSQEYTLLHRKDTERWRPVHLDPNGWQVNMIYIYERCKPFPPDDVLPQQYRDKYTDFMKINGKIIHTSKNIPLLPGRGMGYMDTPNLKIIGEISPGDVFQGNVKDCWLLSGISALAEYEHAIRKVFRKNKNLDSKPEDTPSLYTITLWDLSTWKEVDIVIDERLCANPDPKKTLLASKPSTDGELWVPYLEKAVAIHCGGWDDLKGGYCTHAWSLLTGIKEQYIINLDHSTRKWDCRGNFNSKKNEWKQQANSPRESDQGLFRLPWPLGEGTDSVTSDEVFSKMCAWKKANYLVAAGTTGTSDENLTDGLMDNHGYIVLDAVENAAGTGVDLCKIRNPWGQGELETGQFTDEGPGWSKYPQIKKLLKPVVADDGIFWVTKKEFGTYFQTIYLCAADMTKYT